MLLLATLFKKQVYVFCLFTHQENGKNVSFRQLHWKIREYRSDEENFKLMYQKILKFRCKSVHPEITWNRKIQGNRRNYGHNQVRTTLAHIKILDFCFAVYNTTDTSVQSYAVKSMFPSQSLPLSSAEIIRSRNAVEDGDFSSRALEQSGHVTNWRPFTSRSLSLHAVRCWRSQNTTVLTLGRTLIQ